MDENKQKFKDNKKARKLIRSPEVTVCDIPAAVVTVATTAASLMGGGITTPQTLVHGTPSNQGVHRTSDPKDIQCQSFNQYDYASVPNISGKDNIPFVDSSTAFSSGSCINDLSKNPSVFGRNTATESISGSAIGVTTLPSTILVSNSKSNSSACASGCSGSNAGIGSSDSATFTRLHNFLFKSSDSGKSTHMKQYSSESVPYSLIQQPQQQSQSQTLQYQQQELQFKQKQQNQQQFHQSSEEEQGYYLSLTSPNNPFLPEIITKTYNNEPIQNEEQFIGAIRPPPTDLNLVDTVLTSPIRNLSSPSSLTGRYQCLSPSREQHITSITTTAAAIAMPASHKKLFTLSSPIENRKPCAPQQQQLTSPKQAGKSLNPFLNSLSVSSNSNQTNDLNSKREEFLKATMKICLVVSPPSNKLQMKSKSLTHLDTLDTVVAACQNEPAITRHDPNSDQLETMAQITSQPLPQTHIPTTCTKICCLGSTTPTTTSAPAVVSPGQTTTNQINSTQTSVSVQKKKPSFMQRKKPILTRSEVSSSDYISVYFYTESGCQEEELIAPIKGVSLAEALSSALKRRNLTFSQISISDNNFQITGDLASPPYTTSLDENTDIESLSGKLLIVTEKDSSKRSGTLQKAASFGSRTRPPRLLSSASTEESVESEQKIIPGKQLKQRWSGLFGIKNPQQTQLCELLNNYSKNGVPQKTSSFHFDHADFDLALEYLDKVHKSWRDFVNCPAMSDNDVKIQSAIWELVTTEVDYIHALQTVTDLFLACLEAIQDEKLLTDVDQNKLFSNIRDICEANLKFWTLYLYPMVAHSIANSSPLCVDFFQEGFVTFASTFAPYKKYCAEQSTCQFYCKELNRNNPLFTAYLAWCESQKMCNRLRLADILVRPMQRLTKYSLLLSAVRKHISDENDADIMDSMIHSVENFVCSVNSHLTTRQENERLKGIMARIESYDVVDSNNEHLDKLTKQYCTMFDLCSPMKGCTVSQGRHLFMEGDLKFKDSIGKADAHCFLLTDILLVCKTIAKKGQGTLKVIRQPFLTDRLVVKHKDNFLYCVYLNEFQMAVTAFTLQCSEAKSWHDAITKAKHIYSRLKQGSNWDGYNLRYSNNTNTNNADTLGIKKSPLNSSIGSRVSSLNNSHSGSVELNDSRNISVDFEKTNSLSSDEGSILSSNHTVPNKVKTLSTSAHKLKSSTSNQLVVQPLCGLGQSLPNLNLNQNHGSNLYHTYSNNTLLVPGTGGCSHSGTLLLSPSHRGISYPPPSPTRATLRRGFAFSSSIKNPPLVKTRNISSQSSFNYQQTSAAAPSTSPQQCQQQQQQHSPVAPLQQQISAPVNSTSACQTLNNESDV